LIEADSEIETRVAVRSSDERTTDSETQIFSIGPTLKFVYAGYVLTAVGAMLLVAALGIFGIAWWTSILIALMLFLIPAFHHIQTKLIRYSLNDTQIEVDEGLISRSTRNIPLRRVQDVSVTTTVMQRLLGFGDLVIDNASETDGKIVLKNIDKPKRHAEMVLKQMHLLDK
jgi:uncharacterized membrane protein YdbT with pleckstrin-like domain